MTLSCSLILYFIYLGNFERSLFLREVFKIMLNIVFFRKGLALIQISKIVKKCHYDNVFFNPTW